MSSGHLDSQAAVHKSDVTFSGTTSSLTEAHAGADLRPRVVLHSNVLRHARNRQAYWLPMGEI